ncbi:MAG: Uncharacterized protein CEN88_230 [Candidatus Berkelbacteria bacterium Licking1014_2]|uniref:LTD domain-containing protein n=1 Tax=Candidatus Berkelbacteria bacterium Licking1014_2 TaxID=2017146 RepID=A0A554LWI2_9BACT|nr:MAG: Uncharacterized protein CEN88_230 [Candidatus Berkelbacteria bacterium Licking1014_2]
MIFTIPMVIKKYSNILKNVGMLLVMILMILWGCFVIGRMDKVLAKDIQPQLLATKIMYNPSGSDTGYEWLELQNQGDEITITGDGGKNSWRFFDGSNHLLKLTQPLVIPSGGFFILADDKNKFLQQFPDYQSPIVETAMTLANKGDVLKLSTDGGQTYFWQLVYTFNMGGDGDGGYLIWQNDFWQPSQKLTPQSKAVYSQDIIISEVLANPVSGQSEFVELYNRGEQEINLLGWQIDDQTAGSSVYTISEDVIIPAGGYTFFDKEKTKLVFNDDGDEVRLLNPDQELVYTTPFFDKQADGVSFARRDDDGVWDSTIAPTPGEKNIIQKPAARIIVTVQLPPPPAENNSTIESLIIEAMPPITEAPWEIIPPPVGEEKTINRQLLEEIKNAIIKPAAAAGGGQQTTLQLRSGQATNSQRLTISSKYILYLKLTLVGLTILLIIIYFSGLWYIPQKIQRKPKIWPKNLGENSGRAP